MTTVLLVEDDPVLARGLQLNLELEGYSPIWAPDLRTAYQINSDKELDLVILDLGLPDGRGFDFLAKVRTAGSRLPIIILSAQSDEDSVVEGLQLGANDYMKKPFGNRELLARIKAVLREPQKRDRQVRFADLVMLIEQRSLMHGTEMIDLNRREFDILLFLMENAEKIASRESLLQIFDKEGEIFDRTIDSHISHLRSRLRKSGVTSVKVSSVYGLGYRLEKA
jgi:two-component system OmpR family response regulator